MPIPRYARPLSADRPRPDDDQCRAHHRSYGGQFHLQPEKQDLATPEYAIADTHDEMLKDPRKYPLWRAGDQDRRRRSKVYLQRG